MAASRRPRLAFCRASAVGGGGLRLGFFFLNFNMSHHIWVTMGVEFSAFRLAAWVKCGIPVRKTAAEQRVGLG